MNDRGLAWVALVDWCRQHHWHFLMRIQGQTAVRLRQAEGDFGPQRSAASLAPVRGGQAVLGAALAFKTAGYRAVNVVAVWLPQAQQRWLLVTDLPACLQCCQDYGRRMDAEHGFRDQKSHGLNWQASRIKDPEHMSVLVLGMMLALYLLYCLAELPRGDEGLRGLLERLDRHVLSVLQLGIRWLKYHFLYAPARWPQPPPLKITVGS